VNQTPVRKRIAIFLPDLRGGGAERLHILLAQEFTTRGYLVDFVLMETKGDLLNELNDNIGIIDLKAQRIRGALFPFKKYLNKKNPDAIIVPMWPLTIIGVLAHRMAGRSGKILISDHIHLISTPRGQGISGLIMQITMRLFYPLADVVVAVSQGVKEVTSNLSGLEPERINVIYNPIRIDHNPQTSVDSDIDDWWRQSELKIIAVGSLKAQKDFRTLIHSFAKVCKKKDARLLILGEGAERASLETIILDLGLNKHVMLPGFKSDPYPYLKMADLFVLSSQYEGFGNVIVEAMACGTPVVATDCQAGPVEILDSGKYGTLVPVGDPDALSEAILDSLDKPYDSQQLINRAKEFSVEVAAEKYLSLLFKNKTNTV